MQGMGVMTWTEPTDDVIGDRDEGEWKERLIPYPPFSGSPTSNILAKPTDVIGEHRYEGEWKDGEEHGQGVRTWPDGSRYEGQFKGDTMHGQGVHTTPNGPRYEGTYNLGKRRGHGAIIYPGEQERFEGQFADDHPVSDKDHYPVGSLPGTVFSQEPQAASVIDNSP